MNVVCDVRLTTLQHEKLSLQQQVDTAGVLASERAGHDIQDKLNTMIASLKADHDKVHWQWVNCLLHSKSLAVRKLQSTLFCKSEDNFKSKLMRFIYIQRSVLLKMTDNLKVMSSLR